MDPEELQILVDRMFAAKRRGRATYTADRLHLEGWREGLEEGIRKNLLRLLRLRLGDAASHAEPKIQSASPEQLNLWFDRAAFASTLDDVFREG